MTATGDHYSRMAVSPGLERSATALINSLLLAVDQRDYEYARRCLAKTVHFDTMFRVVGPAVPPDWVDFRSLGLQPLTATGEWNYKVVEVVVQALVDELTLVDGPAPVDPAGALTSGAATCPPREPVLLGAAAGCGWPGVGGRVWVALA